jgi:hypothetical protein
VKLVTMRYSGKTVRGIERLRDLLPAYVELVAFARSTDNDPAVGHPVPAPDARAAQRETPAN